MPVSIHNIIQCHFTYSCKLKVECLSEKKSLEVNFLKARKVDFSMQF